MGSQESKGGEVKSSNDTYPSPNTETNSVTSKLPQEVVEEVITKTQASALIESIVKGADFPCPDGMTRDYNGECREAL